MELACLQIPIAWFYSVRRLWKSQKGLLFVNKKKQKNFDSHGCGGGGATHA
jgi:hypothetical protein